jgi:FkbM family methyltransferase
MRFPTHLVPRAAKNLVPGYRRHWRHSYAALLSEFQRLVPSLSFGETDGVPWLEHSTSDLRLHGFWTEHEDADLFDDLRPDLPRALEKKYFRLTRDYLTRYMYAHMRPDLKPGGYSSPEMMGFHGQHKETIVDFEEVSVREALIDAFRPRPADVIIDGGAFLGFGDIRLASDLKDGTVYAVEASPQCHALLELNVSHNGISNIVPIQRGVWNEFSTIDLQSSYAQANSLVSEVHTGETTVSVPTVTIDGLVESYNIQRVDMISLTLNGAEPEALQGAEETLSLHRPRVRLPGWYTRNGRPISDICREIMERHNYDVFIGARRNTFGLPR